MAYLTNYTLRTITSQLDFKEKRDINSFLNEVIDDRGLTCILNQPQQSEIIKLKYVLTCNNIKELELKFFRKVHPIPDSKKFVYRKGGRPKYHLYFDCEFMERDLIDFHIPEEIRELGDEEIKKFRRWFDDNKFREKFLSGNLSKESIIMSYNIRYASYENFKPVPLESNFMTEITPNSKALNSDFSFDLAEFNREIRELKIEWETLFPCKNTHILAKHNYLISKSEDEVKKTLSQIFSPRFVINFGEDRVKKTFSDGYRISNRIVALLIDYLKWNFRNEEGLDIPSLESFGLVLCNACFKTMLIDPEKPRDPNFQKPPF